MQMIKDMCIVFVIYGTFWIGLSLKSHSLLQYRKTVFVKGAIVL